jgi:hypothetical protein
LQAFEHGYAQFQQALVGGFGNADLTNKHAESTNRVETNQGHGHHPDGKTVLFEAFVKERLQQGWHHGFSDGHNQKTEQCGHPSQGRVYKVPACSLQAFEDIGFLGHGVSLNSFF